MDSPLIPSLPALVIGLLAAPLAWMLAALLDYGLAGELCARLAGTEARPAAPAVQALLWSVLALGFALAVAGFSVALRNWKRLHSAGAGQGRKRFLATWSALASGGFLVAFLFIAVNLILAPLCGK